MFKYILRRILLLIPVLLGVLLIVFTLLYFTPGDPAEVMLGNMGSPEALAELRSQMGLDKSYIERFFNYVLGVLRGDLGVSYTTKQPVTKMLMDAFPHTFKVSIAATIISVVLGLLFGVVSAIKQYSWIDNLSMTLALLGISLPSFWLGMLLILVFSVYLGWLPSSGLTSLLHVILPAATIGTRSAASIARTARSSMLEVIRQDYIVTARSKGQKELLVIMKHALQNALIPMITVVGLNFGEMLGGAIVVESIFSIPGIGSLTVNALKARNYSVVLGGVLYVALVYSIINLIVDLLYTYADPRLKSKIKA